MVRTGEAETPTTEASEVVDSTGESLLERISAAPTIASDGASEEEKRGSSRRQHPRAAGEVIEWEEGDDPPDRPGLSRQLLWSGLMILVLVLALAIFYVKEMAGGKKPNQATAGKTVIAGAESHAILDEILEKDRAEIYKNADGVDPTVEAVQRDEKFGMMQIEEVVAGFLNSETVSARSEFVRDPERVRPLMLSYYKGEEIDAEGLEILVKERSLFEGEFVKTFVQTSDFVMKPIWVARIEQGGGGDYKVDWESWVGFCEFSSEEMRSKKSTDPQLVRAVVSPSNYYNYSFSDDRVWGCFQLEVEDGESVFLGYTKRGSLVELALVDLKKRGATGDFTLKVVYPPNARSADQVEIVEVVSGGWLLKSENEKHDE